jgi:glycosyltransferase involved in cell wall biosynthesis
MNKRLWLTWETQRRNRTLSQALNAELIEMDYKLKPWHRYPKAIANTLKTLLKRRPELVFVQNPSLVLALLGIWYGRISGTPVIVDAHNAGVQPFEGQRPWTNWLARHVMRQARMTIVTNRALAAYVDGVGGRSFVLPDPLPALERSADQRLHADPSVLFICTWAADEPYLEVLKAASRIDPRIRVYITGNSKGRERTLNQPLPSNVVLTGFVPEQRFLELLAGADVIMDLTTREDCLVCGAYEAVAAGKPMVLSNTRALRQYFSKGAVYAENHAEAIAAAIEQAVEGQARLGAEVEELERELLESWARQRDELETELKQRPSGPAEASNI